MKLLLDTVFQCYVLRTTNLHSKIKKFIDRTANRLNWHKENIQNLVLKILHCNSGDKSEQNFFAYVYMCGHMSLLNKRNIFKNI